MDSTNAPVFVDVKFENVAVVIASNKAVSSDVESRMQKPDISDRS